MNLVVASQSNQTPGSQIRSSMHLAMPSPSVEGASLLLSLGVGLGVESIVD